MEGPNLELNLEEWEAELERVSEEHYKKCYNIKIGTGRFRLEMNPIVTFGSILCIWSLVIWCVVDPDGAFDGLEPWNGWITDTWTWLYIGTQDAWAILLIVIYFSKYSKIKLGRDDEEPEFSDASYFTMLFAAGIGVGLFYFGVAEPIMHYAPAPYGNRFWNRYTDDQRAQDALTLTVFHWGVHGWIAYDIMGLLMAFLAYRKGLPMSLRSCFYPILGEKVFGLAGDLVDILSVCATMFGVCTSLGLGAMQINTGFNYLNEDIEINTDNQIITIWCITAVATISVVSGLKVGIRRLSEICFAIGLFIGFIVIFYDNTWYCFNSVVQTFGHYLQYIIQLGFHCDTFAQMDNAPDGLQNPTWFEWWTIFYWGWWIAWCPFVGVFIAKISRGRTVGSFITYTFTLPIIFISAWFAMMGALGIKMEREAHRLNITCDSEFGGSDSRKGVDGIYLLSCRQTEKQWFDLMDQYDGISTFLQVTSLIALVLWFVTSSDSGSLVIDSLSANGHPDPPIPQRVFWALTEGATATGLLHAGGEKALRALQTVSLAAGLPYTFILNFACVALWRVLQAELGEIDLVNGPAFSMDLLDVVMTWRGWKHLIKATLFPWYYYGKVNGWYTNSSGIGTMIVIGIIFYGAVALAFCEFAQEGLFYVGASLYMFLGFYGGGVRFEVREGYKILGNIVEDFFAVLMAYPLAAVQLYTFMEDEEERKRTDDQPNTINLQHLDYSSNSSSEDSKQPTPPPPYESYTNGPKYEEEKINIAFEDEEEAHTAEKRRSTVL